MFSIFSALFFLGYIDKSWRKIPRFKSNLLDMKVSFYVFFVGHPVLILDEYTIFFEDSLALSEDILHSISVERSEGECRYDDIDTLRIEMFSYMLSIIMDHCDMWMTES